jgi:hypothetical protein
MVQMFQNTMEKLVCEIFPDKEIIINSEDKPCLNEKLRNLKRKRRREYQRHGRTEKYLEIKRKFDENLENEKLKYIEKIKNEVSKANEEAVIQQLKNLA